MELILLFLGKQVFELFAKTLNIHDFFSRLFEAFLAVKFKFGIVWLTFKFLILFEIFALIYSKFWSINNRCRIFQLRYGFIFSCFYSHIVNWCLAEWRGRLDASLLRQMRWHVLWVKLCYLFTLLINHYLGDLIQSFLGWLFFFFLVVIYFIYNCGSYEAGNRWFRWVWTHAIELWTILLLFCHLTHCLFYCLNFGYLAWQCVSAPWGPFSGLWEWLWCSSSGSTQSRPRCALFGNCFV